MDVIRNFLNYLLHHDVCPEYQHDVKTSRQVCDLAEQELWHITKAETLLPGDFNRACSEIFGGFFQGIYTADQAWAQGTDMETAIGISHENARKTFRIGLTAYASDEMVATYKAQIKDETVRIINTQDVGLEITRVTYGRLNPEIQGLYAIDKAKGLKILGKLRAKTWFGVTCEDEDLTEDEEIEMASRPRVIKEYEFWVEDEVLDVCFIGMKLRTTVTELNFGLHFFDALFGIHCSFYNTLPNQKIMGWREPEKEWLPPRPKDSGQDLGENYDLMEEDNASVNED